MILIGSEVKACRQGNAQLTDAYVQVLKGEAFLLNAQIAEYQFAKHFGHEPNRTRKLLLSNKELHRIALALQKKGRTCIQLSLYFKKGWLKAEIALATGKGQADQRDDIKEREAKRQMSRALRRDKA